MKATLSPPSIKIGASVDTETQSTTAASPQTGRKRAASWDGPASFSRSGSATPPQSPATKRLRIGGDINSHDNIYARLRKGECANYVLPQTTFEGTSDHLRAAIDVVKEALGPIFPPGFNSIHIVEVDPGENLKGTTLVAKDGKTARVRIKTDASLNDESQKGLYAHALAHELFLHAQSIMEDKAVGATGRSETDDHRYTYAPASAENRYVEAMRRVHDKLDTPQAKRAFAFAMQQDMLAQLEKDEDMGTTDYEETNLWTSRRRDSMDDAIAHRDRHDWKTD